MTSEELRAMRERCDAQTTEATDEDHECAKCGSVVLVAPDHDWEATWWCLDCLHAFWSQTRTDLPRLLDYCEELEREIAELRRELHGQVVCVSPDGTDPWCQLCKSHLDNGGHRNDCILAKEAS